MTSPHDNISSALERACAADRDRGRAMPGAYYLDPDFLALEMRTLFAREWVCVCRAEEIAAPGDYIATEIASEPVAVVRGTDGTIRALSNVCRHRAMPLLDGTGHAGRLVCPYHAWTYDLAGQLIGAPLMDRSDPAMRECRLPEFACEVWHGFVFVALDAHAPPLAPRLAPLEALIAPYHFGEMTTRYTATEIWETNWKSLTENFMEGYHLTPLHKETLHPVNPTRLCADMAPGEAHFGYTVGFSPDMARERRGHPDLTEADLDTCVMFAVPPGLLVGGASDYSSFLCLEPLSPQRVRVRMGLFFHGDYSEAEVAEAARLFHDTMEEDKTVLDRIGRGLASAHYTPGPLAPPAFEGCVTDLARWVARRLLPEISARSQPRSRG